MTDTGSPEGVSSQLSHWLDLPQSWMLRVMEKLEKKNASTRHESWCALPTVQFMLLVYTAQVYTNLIPGFSC